MTKKIEALMAYLLVTGAVILIVTTLIPVKEDAEDAGWQSGFAFTTSTPTPSLGGVGGWWDELPTPVAAIPTMPEFNLLRATNTPMPATQTVLALTPSVTPTRTPLFDAGATITKQPTTTEDQ